MSGGSSVALPSFSRRSEPEVKKGSGENTIPKFILKRREIFWELQTKNRDGERDVKFYEDSLSWVFACLIGHFCL